MKSVAEILRNKPNAYVYSVDIDDSLLVGLQVMAEKGVGALVVLSGGVWRGSSASATTCARWRWPSVRCSAPRSAKS